MNPNKLACFVGAGVATFTLSACSGGQHPTDAFPSSTVEVEKSASYDNVDTDAETSDWLSDIRITDQTHPAMMDIIGDLHVDQLVEPAGENANRFDAVGLVGSCKVAVSGVIPPVDDRFDIDLITPARGFAQLNTVIADANKLLDEHRDQCPPAI